MVLRYTMDGRESLDRDSRISDPAIPLDGAIRFGLGFLLFPGLFLAAYPLGSAISLAMYAFFGFREWRSLDRYIKPRGKRGRLNAVIGVNGQIAFSLLIISLYTHNPFSYSRVTQILATLFIAVAIAAPGIAVAGFVCGTLLIGSFMRRGADGRLTVDWLPATVLYVGLSLNILWGVWVVKLAIQ